MTNLLANNVVTTLAAGIDDTVTSLDVADGSRFPTITGGSGDIIHATIGAKGAPFDELEIIKITVGLSGNTMPTIVRAQQGTTAKVWAAGTRIALNFTDFDFDSLMKRDGATLPTANWDMGGFDLTNVGEVTATQFNVASGNDYIDTGSGNMRIRFNQHLHLLPGGTVKHTFDLTGEVGLGTTTPESGYRLHVRNSDKILTLDSEVLGHLQFRARTVNSRNAFDIRTSSSTIDLVLATQASGRVYLGGGGVTDQFMLDGVSATFTGDIVTPADGKVGHLTSNSYSMYRSNAYRIYVGGTMRQELLNTGDFTHTGGFTIASTSVPSALSVDGSSGASTFGGPVTIGRSGGVQLDIHHPTVNQLASFRLTGGTPGVSNTAIRFSLQESSGTVSYKAGDKDGAATYFNYNLSARKFLYGGSNLTPPTDSTFTIVEDDATANTVLNVLRLRRTAGGVTPTAGIGAGLDFEVETATGNNEIGGYLRGVASDVTATAENFDLEFGVMAAGAAATTTFKALSTGQVHVVNDGTAAAPSLLVGDAASPNTGLYFASNSLGVSVAGTGAGGFKSDRSWVVGDLTDGPILKRVDGHKLGIICNTTQMVKVTAGGVRIESGATSDASYLLHVASTSVANALIVNGSNGRVGIGTTTLGSDLNVASGITLQSGVSNFIDTATGGSLYLRPGGGGGNTEYLIMTTEVRINGASDGATYNIRNRSVATTSPTLAILKIASQTGNLLQICDESSNNYFEVTAGGNVNFGNGTNYFKWTESNKRLMLGSGTAYTPLHIYTGTPSVRLSDSDAGTDSAVDASLEWYRGEDTNRVAFLRHLSSIFYIATDHTSGQVRINAGNNSEVMRFETARATANVPVKGKGYAVANLPTGEAGDQAYATDGRKAGEGGGAGTGVLVFHDGTNWIACDSGATVLA